jgi:hypothetical protein
VIERQKNLEFLQQSLVQSCIEAMRYCLQVFQNKKLAFKLQKSQDNAGKVWKKNKNWVN